MAIILGLRRFSAVLCAAAAIALAGPAFAQSGNGKPQQKKPAAENAVEAQKKIDDIAEASRLLSGPSGNPECVWLGRRVVTLLWRDDLDTAFRHLDMYDRFGCPSAHVQATFRCVVRQGNLDPKVPETLNGRVHDCWLNPGLPPVPPAATPQAAAGGTNAR